MDVDKAEMLHRVGTNGNALHPPGRRHHAALVTLLQLGNSDDSLAEHHVSQADMLELFEFQLSADLIRSHSDWQCLFR